MKILCLGDSHTFGFGLPRNRVWTALATAQTGVEFINRAVNGNTTGGMLAAYHQEVEAAKPDAVVLMGGWNDIIYGGDICGARANMGAMAHLACTSGLLAIIGIPVSMCPPIREDWADFLNTEESTRLGAEYILWLRTLCSTLGLPRIDFGMEFPRQVALRGGVLRDYYLSDGLHPNQEGHAIMAEIAAEAVQPFLR